MLMSKIFDRFVEKTPVSVMARAAMEHAMAPEALDALFVEHADKQYARELLFSSVVDLMAVVVSKVAPSVHAAYQEVAETLPVSITSVYNMPRSGRSSPEFSRWLTRTTFGSPIETSAPSGCSRASPNGRRTSAFVNMRT